MISLHREIGGGILDSPVSIEITMGKKRSPEHRIEKEEPKTLSKTLHNIFPKLNKLKVYRLKHSYKGLNINLTIKFIKLKLNSRLLLSKEVLFKLKGEL